MTILVKVASFALVVVSTLGWSPAGPRAQLRLLRPRKATHLFISKADLNAVAADVRYAGEQRWWSSGTGGGLQFGCTGCGKCCQTDGDVWLDSNEFAELAFSLQRGHEEALESYTQEIVGGWVRLKNVAVGEHTGCVFLEEDGKTCSIYKSRPVQCRTFPYWPRVIFNETTWARSGELPWNHMMGGCEGINHTNATAVPSETVWRNLALYDTYTDAFPYQPAGGAGVSTEDEKSRLLGQLAVIQGVVRSTRAWVKDFVVKHVLCPFAEAVYATDSVRYRVHFGSGKSREVIDAVRYEMLALLTAKEDDVGTTLLMLPFAFASFEEFHAFSLELEDVVSPLLEQEMRGPAVKGEVGAGTEPLPRKRLAQKLSEKQGCPVASPSPPGPLPEIQFAFFHPLFAWSGTQFGDAINFEKRAPFPTINLLRAARIRAWADTTKTSKIANSNLSRLESVGAAALAEEMEHLVRLALE